MGFQLIIVKCAGIGEGGDREPAPGLSIMLTEVQRSRLVTRMVRFIPMTFNPEPLSDPPRRSRSPRDCGDHGAARHYLGECMATSFGTR